MLDTQIAALQVSHLTSTRRCCASLLLQLVVLLLLTYKQLRALHIVKHSAQQHSREADEVSVHILIRGWRVTLAFCCSSFMRLLDLVVALKICCYSIRGQAACASVEPVQKGVLHYGIASLQAQQQ
jgi:hypothetical protein